MRRAARIDRNQPEVVKALRAAGCSVHPTHALGQGFPDLLVAKNGRTVLVEVKDGLKPPSGQKLTEDEQDFINAWRGGVFIVRNIDEALTVASFLGVG